MIDEVDNKVLVMAFTNRLQFGEFLFSIYKNDPMTMTNMLYRATMYMNTEDVMIARESRPKKREKQEDPRLDRGRKSTWMNDRRDERRSRPPTRRIANFTSLNTPLDQVLI